MSTERLTLFDGLTHHERTLTAMPIDTSTTVNGGPASPFLAIVLDDHHTNAEMRVHLTPERAKYLMEYIQRYLAQQPTQ